MISILFVCLGNICRSPAAEGILRHMAKEDSSNIALHIESCGLGDWHIGRLPDERMRETAKNRGVVLDSRAQKFQLDFFDRFDFILVADKKISSELFRHALKPDQKEKIRMITHYSSVFCDQEIPDPYYEGESGFEKVFDMIEDSCRGLLEHIKAS